VGMRGASGDPDSARFFDYHGIGNSEIKGGSLLSQSENLVVVAVNHDFQLTGGDKLGQQRMSTLETARRSK